MAQYHISVSSMFSLLLLMNGIGADVAVAPLFMWSPRGYFTRSQCAQWEVGEVVSAEDISGAVRRLAGATADVQQSPLSDVVASSSDVPEAVVAFVYPKLSTLTKDVQVLQLVEGYLENSASCVSMPFVDAQKTISQTITSALRFNRKAQDFSLQLGSDCDATMGYIRGSGLLSNGVTDLVVVRTDGMGDGACMKRIIELVAAQSEEKVVLALTAEPTSIVTDVSCEIDEPLRSSRVLLQMSPPNNSTSPGVIQYISPPILTALMLSFVLLMFLLIGVSCLLSVDAPQRFATESLPVPKEY